MESAVEWVKAHKLLTGGVPPHHKSTVATMEVTGYLIPTLKNVGEEDLAAEFANWEASVQAPDGSFVAPDGTPYTFDTAQVIRGFLAMLEDLPHLEGHLRRAADYVERQIGSDGSVATPSYDMWWHPGGTFSDYAHLYALPPLLQAGERLGEDRYIKAVRRGMEYYRSKQDLVEFKPAMSTFSHIFGYMMEALVELGEFELARKGLAQAAAVQREDGAIPAFPGARWVCSTGMAQLAVAWYKLGERAPADKAMAYLAMLQNDSGGFYGSYGKGASYFPAEEISWAVKFFLDALLLKK